MNPNDPNVVLVELVANHLGEDFRKELVFVGGAVAGLLITDPAFPAIRATQDVDLIVQVVTLAEYHATERALRARGFVQDMSPEAPICRWRVGSALVDVMPTLDNVLGFSNRWYPLAIPQCRVGHVAEHQSDQADLSSCIPCHQAGGILSWWQ